ncbi:MAG: DUF1934 domain-containing protein [Lachnospiraceae bacterium]|nr:DUF1934 domain-containing protein [Lachnospiraceae bacterium]
MEKIRLRISGEQTDEAGNVDRNETAAEGILFREGNRFRVEYTERPSEGTDTVRSRLLLSEGGMEMVREGALRSYMTFQPGHSCRMEYGTPFGSMFMEIETEFYRLLERKKSIHARARYRLRMDAGYSISCAVTVRIDLI